MARVLDTLGRTLRSLRLSVTDRCNLRCQYCMPEEDYVWLPRGDVLHFEEISQLVDVFAALGVDRLRLTGGEPLTRRELPVLIRMLASKPAIRDLALTTNGLLLAEQAGPLREAGLHRLTVSLDTLRPERFAALTRRDALPKILDGIEAARKAGFDPLKLDAVMIRGANEDELPDLLEFARSIGAELRFIEYMDVGGATAWSMDKVLSRQDMLEALAARYGRPEPVVEESSAPAQRFRLPDGTVFGIIASTTVPFCQTCDRSRVTADGMWYHCLYARQGLDLRGPLRRGDSREELERILANGWNVRADRGAEQRFELRERGALAPAAELRHDPHLEMHTRGG